MKNRITAEFLGTFFLVLFGCGAAAVNDMTGILGHGGVAASFGLVVMVMIYSVGNISGAHLNPAVTLGFFLARRIRGADALPYMAAQSLGALAGAFLLLPLFSATSPGVTLPAEGIGWGGAFVLEAILTGFLMFVILNVSTGHMEKGIMAGVAVGGAVALCALVGGPLTGASMNPARSLGPAVASGEFGSLWVYLTAPFIGSALASQSCRVIQGNECCAVKE